MNTARPGDLHAVAGETRDRYRSVVLGVTRPGARLAALTSGTLVIALGAVLSVSRGDDEPADADLPIRRMVAA